MMILDWHEWLTGSTLVGDVVLRTTVVLVLAWATHLVLARGNPRWRVLLWRFAAVGLAAIPLLTVVVPKVAVPVEAPGPLAEWVARPATGDSFMPAAGFDTEGELATDQQLLQPVTDVERDPAPIATHRSPAAAELTGGDLVIHWGLIAAGCWLGGVMLLAVRWLLIWARFRRVTAALRQAPERCQRLLHELASQLGAARQVELRVSDDLDVPFVTGIFRSVIVLPARMVESDYLAELPAILGHELAHHQSRDVIWMGILQWVEVLAWCHPLVWRIRQAHSMACEEVADAAAATIVGGVTYYSGTLARVALSALAAPPAVAAIPMARSPEIITRLARLKRGMLFSPLGRRPVFLALTLATAALLGLVGLNLVPTGASAAPEPGTRSIQFPASHSVGKIYISDAEEPSWLAVQRFVDYHKHWNWSYLCEAQGTVTVPTGDKVKLVLGPGAMSDAGWSSQLAANDLHTVYISGYRFGDQPFGDAQIEPLRRLTGLEELQFEKVHVSDAGWDALKSMRSLKVLGIGDAELGNDGLQKLGRLSSLEALGVFGGMWDDAGLAGLSKLRSLREFYGSAEGLRGPGLKHIAQLPSLIYVMSGSKQFTDRHLAALKDAKSLKGLRIQQAGISDDGLKYLAGLEQLEYLDLWGTSISDAGLVHLRPLKNLKRLNLRVQMQPGDHQLITDRGLADIAEISSLEYLDLPNLGMTDECCDLVSRLPNLTYLWIGGGSKSTISDDGIRRLTKLRHLETLQISGTGITDEGLAQLATMTSLKNLRLHSAPGMTDAGLGSLGKLKSLETLVLPMDSRITNAGLSQLNGLSNLKLLDYLGMTLAAPDEPPLDISGLTRMEELTLPPMRDQDMACLSNMENLRVLSFVSSTHGRPTIGDKGAAQVARLTHLERLSIGGPEMTDAALSELARLPELNRLGVTGQFTDEGIKVLGKIKGLEELTIRSEQSLSDGAKQELANSLPNLRLFTVDGERVFNVKERDDDRGKAAPAFTATTLNGKPLALDDYAGKVVLLYFWSTSCAPCVKSTPVLKQNYEEVKKDHQDFELISLSLDDGDERVRKYVADNGIRWPQVRIGLDSKVAADYGVVGLPKFVLVGRDGVIIYVGDGGQRLATAVNQVLGEP